MTSDIYNGLHAPKISCAHQMGEIDRGMRASPTTDDICHGLHTSEVCIKKTSTEIKRHHPRHARIKCGVCASTRSQCLGRAQIGQQQMTSVMAFIYRRNMCAYGKQHLQKSGNICQSRNTSKFVCAHHLGVNGHFLQASDIACAQVANVFFQLHQHQPRRESFTLGLCTSVGRHH